VPDPLDGSAVDEVAHPVEADRRRADRLREVHRAGVVGDHHSTAGQQRREAAEGQRVDQRPGGAAHPADDPVDQVALGAGTRDEDVGVERVADGAEALRGPAPPGVRGARVQHDRRRAAVGDDRRGRLAVVVGQLQHRLVPDGPRADQPNHFEVPEDLGLVVRVAHPAVQRWRVIGAQPGGDPRAQRGDQRVGVAAAAVQLDRQVEALGAHRGHERRVDVRQRRQLHHPVDRPRAPGQEPGMPRGAEQHDLGRGIGGPQRLERGQREDEVAERVGTQYRDLPDVRLRHACSGYPPVPAANLPCGLPARPVGTRSRTPSIEEEAMAEAENLISVLVTDHREVEEMFTELETEGLSAQRRSELRDKVITELVRHSVAEEMYLYPTTRKVLPGGDQLADREIEEHAAAERLMKDLEKVDPQDARFDDLLTQLITDVRGHVGEEETDLFPRLEAACSDQELAELGAKVQQAKKLAPTRPHPSAPDTPPMNKVMGPPMGLVDRVRDALSGRAT